MFWNHNGLNKLPIRLADPTMASLQANHSTCDELQSWYTAEDPEQEFRSSDMHRLNAWFNFTCYHPPQPLPPLQQPPGQVHTFRPGQSCPGDRGVGEIKKYLLFDFVQYVLFLARFIRWLRTSRLHIFKEKSRNLLESGWRGITFQNKVCIIYLCPRGAWLQVKLQHA